MSSANWKKANYNRKIKVSEATVALLRKGSKASNIRKANSSGASAEYKEAVRRFYGKNTVKDSPAKPTVKVVAKPAVKPAARKAVTSNSSAGSTAPKTSSGSNKDILIGTGAAAGVYAAAKAKSRVTAGQDKVRASKHAANVRGARIASASEKSEIKSAKTAARMDKAATVGKHTRGARINRQTGALNKMRAVGTKAMGGRSYSSGKRKA